MFDSVTPQTVFSRQEYWNGLPFPPQGDLPNQGIQPTSSAPTALAGTSFITDSPGLLILLLLISYTPKQN